MSDDTPPPPAALGTDQRDAELEQLRVELEQHRVELEQQCRMNLELRAELDDCRQSSAVAFPLPAGAWQLPQLQLALAPRLGVSAHLSPAALELAPPDTGPGWLARLRLAWLQLGHGLADAAAALQAELSAHLPGGDAGAAAGLDLLNRVLASQRWLADSPTTPPAEHNALASTGLRMAIDELSSSSCAQAIAISGWCIDPARQLAALVLLRGPQAVPVPLACLERMPRPDLAPLLQEQGLDPRWPAGLRLRLGLPPLTAAAQPMLFVLLHNGDQFCLALPPSAVPFSWAQLLAEPLAAWPAATPTS